MTAAKKKSTAVAEKKEELPATEYDYGEDAGGGFENQTKDDYSIPFIGLLQALSPQVVDETIPGARPGMFVNTVTEDLFVGHDGFSFVPCHTEHVFGEWVPRNQGGGLAGIHQPDAQVVLDAIERSEKFGKYSTPDGNELVETFYTYGIAVTENGLEMAVITFKSTGIKAYRAWQTKARNLKLKRADGSKYTPPLWSHMYRITSFKDSNPEGDFFNIKVRFDGENAAACRLDPTSEEGAEAKAFRDMIKSGIAKADFEKQNATGEGQAGGDDMEGEDIPF